MTYQWTGSSEQLPVVEFHDVRAEKLKADSYLAMIEGPLAAPFVGAGGALMGQFGVEGHPDRVVLVRGFRSPLARRKAYEAYHASREWQEHREAVSGLVRDN